MAGQSLGLIETVGLGVAIEAADAAMKSANVELIGYELTKGGGLVVVKLAGDVGAINAAVSAGVAAARRTGRVYAWKVIARTASGIDALVTSKETMGMTPQVVVSADNLTNPPAQQSTIPIVNIEPVIPTGDCLAMREERLDSPPTSQLPVAETEPVVSTEISEDKGNTLISNNKPIKSRQKGNKR